MTLTEVELDHVLTCVYDVRVRGEKRADRIIGKIEAAKEEGK